MICRHCGEETPVAYVEGGYCPNCRCNGCGKPLAAGEEFMCAACKWHFAELNRRLAARRGQSQLELSL